MKRKLGCPYIMQTNGKLPFPTSLLSFINVLNLKKQISVRTFFMNIK